MSINQSKIERPTAGPNLRSIERSADAMASAEREPVTGVWGRSPSGVLGQSPAPEAESFLAFKHPMKAAHLLDWLYLANWVFVKSGITAEKRGKIPVPASVQCEQLTGLPRHWLSTHVTVHFSDVVRQPISASLTSTSDRLNHTLPLVGGSAQPKTAHVSTHTIRYGTIRFGQ